MFSFRFNTTNTRHVHHKQNLRVFSLILHLTVYAHKLLNGSCVVRVLPRAEATANLFGFFRLDEKSVVGRREHLANCDDDDVGVVSRRKGKEIGPLPSSSSSDRKLVISTKWATTTKKSVIEWWRKLRPETEKTVCMEQTT